jgi:MFS family permease
MSPRLATFLVFVINGSVVGTWVAFIPTVKDRLDASGSEFGVALLFAPFGALVAQQVVGQLLMRVSSRQMTTATSLILPWLVILPVAAPSLPMLAASLFLLGAFNSSMDVSMNAHGVALEDRDERSIMSGLHGGWSLGGILAPLVVALSLQLGVEPVVEAIFAAVVLFALSLVASRHLGTGSVKALGGSGLHLPTRAILPLAGLVALIAFVEGGLTDWGGVYLAEGLGAGESTTALAFSALSLGLFAGRMGGDWAKDRVGSIRLIQLGMAGTAVVVVVMLLLAHPLAALVGLVLAGVGIANTIPQIFAAAGRIPPAGPSLSAVFTSLTVAFMVGPPIIGSTADAVGIAGAFTLFAIISVVVALVAGRVPSAETNPRFQAKD